MKKYNQGHPAFSWPSWIFSELPLSPVALRVILAFCKKEERTNLSAGGAQGEEKLSVERIN